LNPMLCAGLEPSAERLPAGPHRMKVRIEALTELSGVSVPATGQLTLDVVDEAPFSGRVCIDFGTTESGAAVSKGKLRPGRPPRRPPAVIELGTLGLAPKQIRGLAFDTREADATDPIFGQRFLPTTLALTKAGHWLVGEDIPPPEDPDAPPLLRFERFKWLADLDAVASPLETVEQLLNAWEKGERGIPNRADPKLLLGAFLSRLRALIEEHPDVAGTIGGDHPEADGARVFATRPVVMGPRMERAFTDGFAAAGMPHITAAGFGTTEALILESWSPLVTVTEQSNAEFTPLTLDGQAILRTPIPDDDTDARLMVFDIGGGSADLSVIAVRTHEGKSRVEVFDNVMSRKFVGIGFEASIGAVLRAWFGKDETWPVSAGGTVEREFNETVRWLQNSAGPLAALLGVPGLFYAERKKQEGSVEEGVRKALATEQRGLRAERLFARRPHASALELDYSRFPELVAKLEERFRTDYWDEMKGLFDRLWAQVPTGESTPHVWITISGRGAACPLADTMIRALIDDHGNARQPTFLIPPVSKSITSWGALRLADHLESRADMTFVLPLEEFGVGKGYRGSRILTEPMRLLDVWSFVRSGAYCAEPFREGEEAPAGDPGHPVTLRRVAIIPLTATYKRLWPAITVYSGRSDGGWEQQEEGVATRLDGVPDDRQWVCFVRGHQPTCVEADNEIAAIEKALEEGAS
jgi:hypothetical protein